MDRGDIGQNDKSEFGISLSFQVLLSETREARASRWQQKHLVVVGTHGEYIPIPLHHDTTIQPRFSTVFVGWVFPFLFFSRPLSRRRKVPVVIGEEGSNFPLGGG